MNFPVKELAVHLRKEIVEALTPQFKSIDTRLELIETHMRRHCVEIRTLESRLSSQGRTLETHGKMLRTHNIAIKKLLKEN